MTFITGMITRFATFVLTIALLMGTGSLLTLHLVSQHLSTACYVQEKSGQLKGFVQQFFDQF